MLTVCSLSKDISNFCGAQGDSLRDLLPTSFQGSSIMKKWLFSLKEDRVFYKIVAFTLSEPSSGYVLNGRKSKEKKELKINYITPKGMTLLKDVPKEVILTCKGEELLNRNN